MRGIRIVALALALVLFAPASAATLERTAPFEPRAPSAAETTDVGGKFYLVLTGGGVEIWQESNGKAGLQKSADFDENGNFYPADTKLVAAP